MNGDARRRLEHWVPGWTQEKAEIAKAMSTPTGRLWQRLLHDAVAEIQRLKQAEAERDNLLLEGQHPLGPTEDEIKEAPGRRPGRWRK